MLTKAKGKTRLLLIFLCLYGVLNAADKPQTTVLAGWPVDLKDIESAVLSQDALMGRLVCPALTRLNLLTLKSEGFLSSVQETPERWSFGVKPSAKWWDKTSVSSEDIQNFIVKELPLAVEREGLGRWKLPEWKVRVEGRMVHVDWKSRPEFGPYIFNDSPFRRPAPQSPLSFQCAGELRPELKSDTLRLLSRDGEAIEMPLVASEGTAIKAGSQSYLKFRFGEELHPASPKRQINEELSCEQAIDTPLITLLAWNPQGRWTSEPSFRRAMTHLLPRGALLRAGAGSLGDLISGPILRQHPGYKRNLLVPPYDIEKAEQLLNKLGFRRSEDDGYRRTAKGELMELKVLVQDFEGSTLLRKVLDDSLRAIGIKTSFTVDPREPVDVVLSSIVSSWPESNLTTFLHSRSIESPWPWRYGDASLDKALELYNLSLTHQQPDFTLLEKVHDLVYKLEPFSILMQHRVCLEAQLGKGSLQKRASVKNPDWLSDLLRRSDQKSTL